MLSCGTFLRNPVYNFIRFTIYKTEHGLTVRWHFKNPWPIDKILCHPRDDTFALLHRSSISPRLKLHTTPIAIFRPSSSLPYKKFTVPFGFLNVAYYPTTSSVSIQGASSFSLVGITNKHSVVLFGDNVGAPMAEGSTAKAIIGGASLAQRKTLFQDIFGVSAFADLSQVSPSVDLTPMPRPRALPRSGHEVAELFNAPAYLMPPI